MIIHILNSIGGYKIFITISKNIRYHTLLVLHPPIKNHLHIIISNRNTYFTNQFNCSDGWFFIGSYIIFIYNTKNIALSSAVNLGDASILVEVEESNNYFLMGFIPPNNFIIFKISKLFNIEVISVGDPPVSGSRWN